MNRIQIGGGYIAIVIPAYNAKEYVSDCLNSVLAQTYPNWRVYCVDDGSTDDTPFILDAFAAKDKRIKVFHTPNQGAAAARNFALSQIQDEEWISFVDADDYIAPAMYETIMDAIGNNKVDYVRLFCQHTPLRYDGSKFDGSQQPAVKVRIVTQEEYFLKENVGGYTHSLFLNRYVLQAHPLLFPTKMKILEDQAFSISCATYSKRFLIMEEPRNYFYYSNNANSLTKQSRDNSNDIIRCLNIVYRQFSECCSEKIMDNYFYAKYLPSMSFPDFTRHFSSSLAETV
ncbi:MAG: glycosyltransferase family 2 protein, partial [Prevotella sp.]